MKERPLRADVLRNRIRILVAAESAFGARGINATTGEIARLAGVSVATLYRHFATRDTLLDAVFAARLQRLADRVADAATRPDPGRALFDFLVGITAGNPRERIFCDPITEAGLDVAAAVARPAHPLHRRLGELVARARHAGQVRPDLNADSLMRLMAGAAHAMRLADPPERALVLRFVIDGLRPPAGTHLAA
jgi:AcrR family transcriptional regulator